MLVLIIAILVASGLVAYAVSKSKSSNEAKQTIENFKKVDAVVVESPKPKKELQLKEKKPVEKKATEPKKTTAKKQNKKK